MNELDERVKAYGQVAARRLEGALRTDDALYRLALLELCRMDLAATLEVARQAAHEASHGLLISSAGIVVTEKLPARALP